MVTERDIRDLAAKIAADFRPQRIILFGSRARGSHKPDSDVDILVVLKYQGRSTDKAVEILDASNPRFSVDLLVRTPEELAWRYEHLDPIARDALDHGVVLYQEAA